MISKLPNVGTSIFTIMSKMAHENGALNLSQGFPDFKSDPMLIAMVDEAMKAGHNQYAPMPGDAQLRQEISGKMAKQHQKHYNWETEVTLTSGATQAIFTAIAAVIHKGDEVILFTPAYDCYEPAIELFGGIPVHVQLRPPSYGIDWDEVAQKISKRTKMIMINSGKNSAQKRPCLFRKYILREATVSARYIFISISLEDRGR